MNRIKLIIVVLAMFCCHVNLYAQSREVSGKVTEDLTLDGLPGVTVQVKGQSQGTVTSGNGTYKLTVPDNATLVFSSIGYTTQEILVGNRSTVDVVLDLSDTFLEQVVVVGYGAQKKEEVTGAITNLKGEEIAKQASQNAISALQGKVAGVNISNSGKPGESPQIRIRGLGTVYGNLNPLYVVDGVWFDDISFLNPADIENMSILKDASAQSIYGIRAANGVVLISTKRGRLEQTSVNYNGFVGVQTVTNQVEMANANEFAVLVNELAEVNGSKQVIDPSGLGKGTNWADQVLRNALIHNHQLSFLGGSEKSSYAFSFGYLDQQGIVKTNDYKRYTIRINNDYKVFKPLKVGYSVIGVVSNSNEIPDGIFGQMFAASPVVPVFNADGSYGDPTDYSLGDAANYNLQATLDFDDKVKKTYGVNGSIFGELKFAKHFTLRSSYGMDFGQRETKTYQPKYDATFKQRSDISNLIVDRYETRNWIVENILTYDNTFADKHNLKVLLGQGAQQYRNYTITGSSKQVPNVTDGDLYLKLGDVNQRSLSDNGELYTVASYFGRVNYDFAAKYLLTLSLRADGASKFYTGGNAWGYFPAVGLGWLISEESFMKNQNVFETLKIRGSWGKIGNASVPNNIAILRVDQKPQYTAIFGGQPYTGGSINSVVPPYTVWEQGVGTDIGLEASMLHNSLSFEIDFYDKRTKNAIFDIPILNSVGTESGNILGNQADFQNKGFEFAATWRKHSSDKFSYSISGNIGINENKVLATVTGDNPIEGGGSGSTGGAMATRTIVGQPIGHFFGYEVIGVFQNKEEAKASAQKNAKPGDFIYKDTNSDGVISGRDRRVLGNPNPKYTYGINTNFNVRDFDVTLDFQGVADVDIFNGNIGKRYGNENFTKKFFDNRWHGQGTSNEYPSANLGGGQNYLPNSFFVENGSYFRVRNVQLGYTLPQTVLNAWKMQKIRVYANAQNPLTFFKYSGFSPELVGNQDNNKDRATNSGIDNNVYPLSATYNLGVNITF